MSVDVAAFTAAVTAHLQSVEAGPESNEDALLEEQLRALGYLT